MSSPSRNSVSSGTDNIISIFYHIVVGGMVSSACFIHLVFEMVIVIFFTMQVTPAPMRERGGAIALSPVEAVTVRRTQYPGAQNLPLRPQGKVGHVMDIPLAGGMYYYFTLYIILLVFMRDGKVIRYEESSNCSFKCTNGQEKVGSINSHNLYNPYFI